MKTIFFLLISGIFLYALLILVLFFTQRSLLYFPSNERLDLSQYAAIGLEEVKLKTEDGLELTAWFMRPDPARDGRTFLLFHGNAGHIGHRVEKFRRILEAGYGFLFLEYRGYGGNPGKPYRDGFTYRREGRTRFPGQQGNTSRKGDSVRRIPGLWNRCEGSVGTPFFCSHSRGAVHFDCRCCAKAILVSSCQMVGPGPLRHACHHKQRLPLPLW